MHYTGTKEHWMAHMSMEIGRLSDENKELKKKLKEYEEFGTPVELEGLIRAVTHAKTIGELDPVLRLVVKERIRQDEKWGVQNHDNPIWSMILGEEVGEVQQEALEIWAGEGSIFNLRQELIQVAAVAISWYECIKRNSKDLVVLYDDMEEGLDE